MQKKTCPNPILLAAFVIMLFLSASCASNPAVFMNSPAPINPIVTPQPVASSSLPAATEPPCSITVATYNVHALAGGKRLEDVSEVIREADADIVALQEIDRFTKRSGKRDMAALLAKACPYPYHEYVKTCDYQGGGFGIMLLSKYPIESVQSAYLDVSTQTETRKVMLAKINIDGAYVWIANTHLPTDDYPATVSSLFSLNAFLKEHLPGNQPALVMGDFNDLPAIISPFLEGFSCVDTEHPTFPLKGTIIDNIFINSEFSLDSYRVVADFHASDHFLLSAKICYYP